jgi:hypothetical protein
MAGAAAGAVIGILSFLGCIFWMCRRKLQSRDGTVRIIQDGVDYPDLIGTEITPYHYEPQADASAGAESSLSDLESGPDHTGSDPSGPGAEIWNWGSGMRQYTDCQILPMSNMLEMGCGGGGSLATLGTCYPSTLSISTSMMKHSLAMMGHSNSYGSGCATSPSTAFPPPPSYSPFSAKERRQREATGPSDSEVEVEAFQVQRSDNAGRGRFFPRVDPSVTGETPPVRGRDGTAYG